MALPPQRPPPKLGPAPPAGSEDSIQKSRRQKDELEEETRKLEEELELIKVKYEQYLLGVERKEPVRQREDLRRRVMRVKEAFTRNTGLKFRIQSLHARFLSYERLWLRSAREKEEGTYRRDLFKARLRARRDEPAPPPEAAAAPVPGMPPADAPAPPAPPPLPKRAAKPAAAAPVIAAGAMSEAQMRALYSAYVAAKKSCNEDVTRLTYDAIAKSVSKQIPEIMARYKASSVEFKVEVKAGRAILKAVPKV